MMYGPPEEPKLTLPLSVLTMLSLSIDAFVEQAGVYNTGRFIVANRYGFQLSIHPEAPTRHVSMKVLNTSIHLRGYGMSFHEAILDVLLTAHSNGCLNIVPSPKLMELYQFEFQQKQKGKSYE